LIKLTIHSSRRRRYRVSAAEFMCYAENTQHPEITVMLDMKCYFVHPYVSWERGTNEHINGLIRWYLHRETDFSKISDVQIAEIESLINNRPRKCLLDMGDLISSL